VVTWLDENSAALYPVLVVAGAVLLVAALVLLALWLRARHLRVQARRDREDAELDLIDVELALAEQTARLRIIRELHEISVHNVSRMVREAEGVRYSAETDPTAALRSVGVIETAARNLLADLRRVMTVVAEGGIDADAPARLDDIGDLFDAMRRDGLRITVEESGDRFDLVPGAELAVHRILREALGNSLDHGGEGTEVLITVTWTEEGLRVLIADDGERSRVRNEGRDPNRVSRGRSYSEEENLAALTGVASGSSITEMRERAELFGGVFEARAVPGVGFSVSVVFPALRFDNGVHGVNL
jgi:signal transduction histidine kinase